MPIKRCKLPNGQYGYQWGSHGTCYLSRASAERQAAAAYANGYKGHSKKEDDKDEDKEEEEEQQAKPKVVRGYVKLPPPIGQRKIPLPASCWKDEVGQRGLDLKSSKPRGR